MLALLKKNCKKFRALFIYLLCTVSESSQHDCRNTLTKNIIYFNHSEMLTFTFKSCYYNSRRNEWIKNKLHWLQTARTVEWQKSNINIYNIYMFTGWCGLYTVLMFSTVGPGFGSPDVVSATQTDLWEPLNILCQRPHAAPVVVVEELHDGRIHSVVWGDSAEEVGVFFLVCQNRCRSCKRQLQWKNRKRFIHLVSVWPYSRCQLCDCGPSNS